MIDVGGKQRTLPRADLAQLAQARVRVLKPRSGRRQNRTCGSGAGIPAAEPRRGRLGRHQGRARDGAAWIPPRSSPSAKGVELSATADPDGNAITLIGNFRVKY